MQPSLPPPKPPARKLHAGLLPHQLRNLPLLPLPILLLLLSGCSQNDPPKISVRQTVCSQVFLAFHGDINKIQPLDARKWVAETQAAGSVYCHDIGDWPKLKPLS